MGKAKGHKKTANPAMAEASSASLKKPDEKRFEIINTLLGVVVGAVLAFVISYLTGKFEHREKEEALARVLAYSIQSEINHVSQTRSDITDQILPDKSFRIYPSAFNMLHDVQLLDGLKPSIGELKPDVVEAFVRYDFQSRQCVLVRNILVQELQKEMETKATNSVSENNLNNYLLALNWLTESGTNLLFQIKLNYPTAQK